MGVPLYIIECFSLDAFNLCHFSYCVYWHRPIWVPLNRGSWMWMFVSFPKLGKFSAIISSHKFSASGNPYYVNVFYLKLMQRSLSISSFFKILFSFCCSTRLTSTALPSRLLIHYLTSSNLLLITPSVFFISVIVFFGSDWFFFVFSTS